MYMSDLQDLDVINIRDGSVLGTITDICINSVTGNVVSIVVAPGGNFFSLFNSGDTLEIPWTAIIKVGSDVILVDFSVVVNN